MHHPKIYTRLRGTATGEETKVIKRNEKLNHALMLNTEVLYKHNYLLLIHLCLHCDNSFNLFALHGILCNECNELIEQEGGQGSGVRKQRNI